MPCLLGGFTDLLGGLLWLLQNIFKIFLKFFLWFIPSREDSFFPHLPSIYWMPVKYQTRVPKRVFALMTLTFWCWRRVSTQQTSDEVSKNDVLWRKQEDDWCKLGGQLKPTEEVRTRTRVKKKDAVLQWLRVEGTAWAGALHWFLGTDKKASVTEVW